MKIRAECRCLIVVFILAGAPAPAGASASHEAPAARLERAYDMLRAGRTEEAADLFRGIPRSDPAGRRASLELAYLHLREKRWKEAVALLGALLDEAPDDARLRLELGYARQALGDRAAAADEFALAARGTGEHRAQAQSALNNLADDPPAAAAGDALLNMGYDDLRRDDAASAREKFMMAQRADPGRTLIAKQLGYMSMADGDMEAAATHLKGARLLEPRDHQTALELGYIYDSLHDEAAAERSFEAALASADPGVRAAARRGVDEIRGRTNPLYLDIDASASSLSRFSNKILSIEAKAGWKPEAAGPLSFYLAGRGTQDTRSRSGETPEIYADDAVSFAPGVRLQPKGWNTSLSADYGITVNLLRSDDHPRRIQGDGRVVLGDYRYWQGPARLFADAGLSLGYYSRYRDNVIGYLRARAGARFHPGRFTQVTLYAPVNFHKDSNRDFYNNIAEAGAGIELQPTTRHNLNVRAEYLRGVYTGIEGRDRNPYGPRYEEVRLTVAWFAHFTRRPKAEPFEPTRRRRFVW
jgi:tetratricopeptide (TPR) repeat protein